jgi:ABC-2 type transport system permease protein
MTTVLPGVAMALIAGTLRYGFVLRPSFLVIPAIALVALTGAAVGYTLAAVSSSPELTQLLTQVIIFALFLFSPIAFPADRLPDPVAWLHTVLPVRHMADAVRGALTGVGGHNIAGSLAILLAWCAPTVGLSHIAISRRR